MRGALFIILIVAACAESATVSLEGPVPDAPGLKLELIYAAAVSDTEAEIGGLDGAAIPGAKVSVTGVEAIADARGRFAVRVPAKPDDTVMIDEKWAFRVRDVAKARAAIVRPALSGGAGDAPNDLVFLDRERALLVRSGDDALSIFDPADGISRGHGVRLLEGDTPAAPWFAAIIDAKTIAVTAQLRHVVYIVDLETDRITKTLEPPIVRLPAPFTLSRPKDVDGDGADDLVIESVKPRAPQGIAIANRRLIAAFSGFIDTNVGEAVPAVFVPGVVFSWSLDDLDLPPATHVTPALDPQEVLAHGEGQVLVTMSGAVSFVGSGKVTTSSGAVELLDAATLSVVTRWDLGDFAPTTAVIADDLLWVGSLANGTVRALDSSGAIVLDLKLNDETVDSIFRFVLLPGGLIGAGSNNTDRLHVIDPVTRKLDPLPFGGPIQVGPGRPLFDGLQVMARRPGRAGVDFVGPDVFAMMRASKIIPLELRKVLGP